MPKISTGQEENTVVTTSDQTTSTSNSSEAENKAQPEAGKSGEQPSAAKPGEGPNKPNMPPGKPGDAGKPEKPSGKPGDAAKPEGPKPTMRPQKPLKPPDPDELKVRPDAEGKVRFNFNGQPWQPVLEWLAEISGMSLDWQELPGDYLNLKSRQSYTVRETRELINMHLLARGYTLLCQGEVLSVANIKKLDPSLVPRVTPQELDNRDPHEFVKVSFPLDWLLAEAIIDELNPMKSPNGKLTALKATNRLEAVDAVINLRDIRDLLSNEQSTTNQEQLVHEFVLQYARASEVFDQLQTLVGESKSQGMPGMPGGPNQPGMDPAQQQAMMARMQQQPPQNKEGKQPAMPDMLKPKPQVTLVLNQRRNSILANAPPDKMAIIKQAVDALDVPLDSTQSLLNNVTRMQVYRLAGVDPEPVVKTLQEIGNLDPTTRLQVDKKNKAIIAYASLADHVTIRSVVEKLSGSERGFEVIRLRRLAADYVAGSISFMMVGEKKKENTRRPWWDYGGQSTASEPKADEFRVEADVEHNRLLLWANEIELGEVENLLVKLGEIPPKGSRHDTVRVIDTHDSKEGEELLERIRRAWPTTAPNPLLVKPPPDAEKPPIKSLEEKLAPPEPATKSVGSQPSGSEHLKFVQFSREEALRTESKEQTGKSAPPTAFKEQIGKTAPPVEIKMDSDGRIIISSEDPAALDAFEDLASQLSAHQKEYSVFRLKYAWAYGVALNLQDFFKDDEKKERRTSWFDMWYGDGGQDDNKDDRSGRLSKRRPLKFISDGESNTIIVENADAAQLKTIKELIDLYDKPPSDDSQSVRKTDTIHLQYSKAKTVADTIKDVYRDLLSDNDKALQGNNRSNNQGRTFIYEFSSSDDGKKDQKMPKFKGQLSIGVDELSNSLAISAPAYLFDQVSKMAKDLDEAAAPTSTIKVVKLGEGVSAKAISDILNGKDSSSQKNQPQNQQPRNRQQSNNRNRSSTSSNRSSSR